MYRSDLIKGAMAAHDKTVDAVAKDAGVSTTTVTSIRKGNENITLLSLKKVANATGFLVEINFIPKSETARAEVSTV